MYTTKSSAFERLRVLVLSLALVLTSATQLRFGTLAFGLGELLLVVWIVLTLLGISSYSRIALGRLERMWILFWSITFLLLLAGWLVTAMAGRWENEQVRDLMAFMLSAGFVVVFVTHPKRSQHSNICIKAVVALSAVAAGVLLVVAFADLSIGFLDPWYGPSRLRGWSVNPNQMALLLVVLPPFLLQWMANIRPFVAKLGLSILLIASVVAGIATGSDALVVAWIGSALILVVSYWYRYLARGRRTSSIWQILILAFVVLLLVVVGDDVYRGVQRVVKEIYEKNGQGETRLMLWRHGVLAIMYSPIFGHGPGSQSGLSGPFGGAEAHNTLIDWGGSTGLVGVLMLLGLLVSIGWRLWRNGDLYGLSALAALVVFSQFHYVMRHPLVWFYLSVLSLRPWSVKGVRLPLAERVKSETKGKVGRSLAMGIPTHKRCI